MRRRLEMNRIYASILLFFITIFAFISILAVSSWAELVPTQFLDQYLSKRAKENLNFRDGPSTDYTVLGVLNKDEYIYISSVQYAPWEYGFPDANTNIYQYYGGVIHGYVKNTGNNNLYNLPGDMW